MHPLLEARDLEDILGQHGHLIDGSAMEDEMADALASLRDQVQDWSDIFNDLSHVEKLAACRALFAAIREFQDRGYVARLGRYTTEDQFEVGVLLFTKITAPENTPELLRAVVPRRLLRNATI